MRVTCLILAALLLVPALVQAQSAQETEFARNALRVKIGFWGSSLVRGTGSEKVSGLGMFAADVDFLSSRNDEIGVSFRSYQTKKNIGGTFYLISMAALIGAFATIDNNNYGDNTSSQALFLGSLGGIVVGSIFDAGARESLSQSIWMYNSTLDTRGP